MTTQSIALFKAIGAKMEYLSQRQNIISQNIANADTPGYQPKDLKPVDFGQTVKNITGDTGGQKAISMTTTDPMHLPTLGKTADPKSEKETKLYEVAPAGNGVVLEEQMVNSGKTQMDYGLMTSLYQKNARLIQIAIGVQG